MIDVQLTNLQKELASALHALAQHTAADGWDEIYLDMRCSPDGSSRSSKLRMICPKQKGETSVKANDQIDNLMDAIWECNDVCKPKGWGQKILGAFKFGKEKSPAASDAWYGIKVNVSQTGEVICTFNHDPNCERHFWSEAFLEAKEEHDADDPGNSARNAGSPFDAVFLEWVARSFDKQLALQDFLNGRFAFEIDFGGARIVGTSRDSKVEQIVFPIQVIGQEQNTEWRWAWDLKELPENVTRMATELRNFGQTHHIPEFTEPTLHLDQPFGNMFSMVASGMFKRRAYYRLGFSSGPVFVVLDEPECPTDSQVIPRVLTIFPQLLSTFGISNHSKALASYLQSYGFTVDVSQSRITASHPTGELMATFDEFNRLTDMKAKVKSAP